MSVASYIDNISKRYALGNATEHTFRGDLQQLIEELVPEVAATNEPKRIECGAPDYVITRKDIPVGYIEAKDVGRDLDARDLKEQFDRYRDALDNLVFTDYLDFRFYVNGQAAASVRIGEVQNGRIVPIQANFEQFTSLIKEFCSRTTQTIKSSKRLAEMMAEKAKILAFIIKNALDEDIAANIESDLTNQMKAFKDILIHDIDAKAFADIYAQTIAYGMFAARLHDDTLDTFSRQEAAEKIPKTNPFLRKLFQFIAAFDLDTRIDWIVDALADLFRATDIAAILKNFGKSTQTHDPIMHFYETFLAEYDPKLRKSRGVFYTPEPVVDFIVRAVDDILKTEFNLPNGLADTSKTKITVNVQGKIQEKEVHKVQILDPATGTGTFLATVIKHIYKGFENQQGVWNQYVDEHLIPRLNGFELLMASYAMAHLKLDLLLTETGYKAWSTDFSRPPAAGGPAKAGTPNARFQIYLTNALEEYHPDTGTLFASWLSTEANEANHIKRDTPVMVVIGNPPYAVSSSNRSFDDKGERTWIGNLIDDYKRDLNERKINLDDDYIKFIRFGQHFVDKTGEGILAYISNNSFIDGITHRKMRAQLMKSFDEIYILDLHGNSKKQEISPDGSKDENVFDIQQGVSINLFVKSGKNKSGNSCVKHFDLFGTRESKYHALEKQNIAGMEWATLKPTEPYFFFVPKDFREEKDYEKGFPLNRLLPENNAGIQTKRDRFVYAMTEAERDVVLDDLRNLDIEQIRSKYDLPDDGTDWSIQMAKDDIVPSDGIPTTVLNRPFDVRYTYFTGRTKGFMARPRSPLMDNGLMENVLLLALRNSRRGNVNSFFVSTRIVDKDGISPFDNCTVFPIYIYPPNNAQQTLDGRTERVPNLNAEIVEKLGAGIGLTFVAEKEMSLKGTEIIARGKAGGRNPGNATPNRSDPEGVEQSSAIVAPLQGADNISITDPAFHTGLLSSSPSATETFAPIDILDYIYAVLHSPGYREKYKEFLKIDFPRVPYPKDAETFWHLVALGGELRQIHLLESPVVNRFITSFNVPGDNVVEKIAYVSVPGAVATGDLTAPITTVTGTDTSTVGSVYFNDTQYFSHVPETAWNFYIGGYQPAQKWLKDRKGRKLSYDDIQHYQKIIVALTETDRLMKEIDKLDWIEGEK